MTEIKIQRAYNDPEGLDKAEGWRVYIDRLWPRGESKAEFHYDLWAKGISPSTELREWFHADPTDRWPEFVKRYTAELEANPQLPELIEEIKTHPVVTLLYSSRDTEHNNAVVIADYLRKHIQ